MTTVTFPNQTVKITQVTKVLVTPIVDDAGNYARAIRIWGDVSLTGPATIELIITADAAEGLRLTTPELEF